MNPISQLQWGITTYKAVLPAIRSAQSMPAFNLERHEEAVLKAIKSGREVAEPG